MGKDDKNLPSHSSVDEVAAFVAKVAAAPGPRPGAERRRGRLIFAMDATASRAPTWDRACHLQGEMFAETADIGGLSVQLVYFRGFNEFTATKWVETASDLTRYMTSVSCLGGQTQIAKVLQHAIAEAKRQPVDALIYVGDCCEEDVDGLCARAGELSLRGVPVFAFHEGFEPMAALAFQQIATLTRGAYCRFAAGSAHQLRDLLRAVAVYAAGGRAALEDYGKRAGGAAMQIANQVK